MNNFHEVWRNEKGTIICQGDSCPKDCDSSCPIYINTMCMPLIMSGNGKDAILLYKEAIRIAPDFYDAWNNLGGIYGEQGNYKDAYECYLKAHNLNMEKPNPVYGLILCTRDLGRYEECLQWCDQYEALSSDGRERTIRIDVNERREKEIYAEDTNPCRETEDVEETVTLVKKSVRNKWLLFKSKGRYIIIGNSGKTPTAVRTPAGNILQTEYLEVAERLFEDVQKYGIQCMSAESLLPWQYTLIDNFSVMKHEELEELLDSCFLKKNDWTYDYAQRSAEWRILFGQCETRIPKIRKWLSRCTAMQMTAACCIGNAYHSINVAFVLASMMEEQDCDKLRKKVVELANTIDQGSEYGPAETIIGDLNTFMLYYGIHLKENGRIIS